jgi:hypothetical protein
MKVSIFSLPKDVLLVLADYLLRHGQQRRCIFQFSTDWKNFLNTNKRHFGIWKKQSKLVKLSDDLADKFVKSSKFRERIYQMVDNPLQQIELFLYGLAYRSNSEPSLKNISVPVVKKVTAKYCTITGFPLEVDTIDLVGCGLILEKEWPALRCLHIENDCFKPLLHSLDVQTLTVLEEAWFSKIDLLNYHALSHLHSLSISYTDSITDVSCFKNIKKLRLTSCPNITDVSSLGAVPDLELSYCSGITDVSSLGTVPKLVILDCSGITDYSAVGNVHELMIRDDVVNDLSILNGVRILKLYYYSQLTHLAALKNLRELHLESYEGNDVSCLENVEILHLSNCTNINDLTMLTKLTELNTDYYRSLYNLSCSVNLKKLVANFTVCEYTREILAPVSLGLGLFPGLEELEFVRTILKKNVDPSSSYSWSHWINVRKMSIRESKISGFPSIFTLLRELEVCSCNCSKFSLPELPSLGYLLISNCTGVFDLDISGPNSSYPIYSVKVMFCSGLRHIRVTRNISSMEIWHCKSLSVLEVYNQIGQLEICECPKLLDVREFAPIIYCQRDADVDDSLKDYMDDL